MKSTLTITHKHYDELRKLIIKQDGLERPALLLCGRSTIYDDLWDGETEERFLSYKVIAIPESEVLENSQNHVTWDTTTFRRAMKICKQESLAMCLVHNHPNDSITYSKIDDENEPSLIKGVFNRNGDIKPQASIVITPKGQIFGRIYTQHLKFQEFSLIRVIGEKFQFHYPKKESLNVSEIFHRQELAFGKNLQKDLSKLTVGVVGCGATGSSTAHLLSRLGVGKILLVDNDIVERSNLSRLYGATAADADGGREKVEVLKDFISGAAIGTQVRSLKSWIGSEKSRSALKSCDVIFGCTDDNSGRIFLNRFAHFYLTPVFDMGIVLVPDVEKVGTLRNVLGRVTVVQTGKLCLLCRGIIDAHKAAEEDLRRSDPEGYERRKDEGYIQGVDNPSPAVITFTSEISAVAVNEFLNRITGFKKTGVHSSIMRFFDQGIDRKPGGEKREGCPICDSEEYWGRGDINPFLDQTSL